MEKLGLVTGAARGIGLGIALELARSGFQIAAFDVVEGDTAPFDEIGAKVKFYKGNLADLNSTRDLISCVKQDFGRLDLLVNNAGVAPRVRADILETSEESYDFVMDINLKGTFFLTQAAANYMLGKGGMIINIASMSSYTSSINRAEYCISKAGISMLTKLFAHRLANENINVYEIRPGIIKTDMTEKVTEKYDRLIAEGITPIQRWGTPDDIALAVKAIASGHFPFSTGEVFNVDGGYHVQRL